MDTAGLQEPVTARAATPWTGLRSRIGASGAFLRGAGWLFSAQLLARVARLGTTLVVARLLVPEQFGVVAIAMTVYELVMVIARFATTPAIVKVEDDALERSCRAAWALNWTVGVALFLVQCAVAVPVARAYDAPGLAAPIVVLALSYLILPLGAVNAALTLRRGDMRPVADAEVRQALGDMALSVALAVSGFGLWSLILPKLLVVPLWIAVHRRASPWRADRFSLEGAAPLVRFGTGVVGVEALGVLRHSVDYLLIGFALGVEALGLYFFAFNAGLGITRGLVGALTVALLPDLCRGDRARAAVNARFVRGTVLITGIVGLWVVFQVLFAEAYVPLVFGAHWVEAGAVPLLVVIALCGVPAALTESGTQYLRARGEAGRDLAWNGVYSLAFTLAVALGLLWGVEGVAWAVLAVTALNAPLHLVLNVGPVYRRDPDAPGATPVSLPAPQPADGSQEPQT